MALAITFLIGAAAALALGHWLGRRVTPDADWRRGLAIRIAGLRIGAARPASCVAAPGPPAPRRPPAPPPHPPPPPRPPPHRRPARGVGRGAGRRARGFRGPPAATRGAGARSRGDPARAYARPAARGARQPLAASA